MLEPLLSGVLRKTELMADDAGGDVAVGLQILRDSVQQLFLGIYGGLVRIFGAYEMHIALYLFQELRLRTEVDARYAHLLASYLLVGILLGHLQTCRQRENPPQAIACGGLLYS